MPDSIEITVISPEQGGPVDIELQMPNWLSTPRGQFDRSHSGPGQKRWLNTADIDLLGEELLSSLDVAQSVEARAPLERALELVRFSQKSRTGLAIILPGREGLATVEVQNDYKWLLHPRYGRFTVYVDGRKAGRVDLDASLPVSVTADESHEIRVRCWWYFSPKRNIAMSEGETKRMHANVRKDMNVLAGMALLMFRPFSALYLSDTPVERRR